MKRTTIRRTSTGSTSLPKLRNICNYKSPWFWLILFSFIYGFGFWMLLPSPNQLIPNQNDKKNNINTNTDIIGDNEWEKISKSLANPNLIDLDFNMSLPINSKNIKTKGMIKFSKPWGSKYSNRILCLIISLWPDRKDKWDLIASTFGKHCDKLLWVLDTNSGGPSSYAGHDTLIINMTRKQGKERSERNIWEKVHRTWAHMYKYYLNHFDWFIKADDDTFLMVPNLKGFLQYHDPNFPYYFGHTIRSRWKDENIVFNSGVAYVLSKGSLLKIGPYLSHLPTLEPLVGRSHCVDRSGAGEDPTTSICLLGVGIRPANTLDHELKERFLIFRPEDHHKIFREDTWYWDYKPKQVKQGLECCSEYLISAHNYKNTDEAKSLYLILEKKYNEQQKNWDEIPLPPRPRFFLYDADQVDFNIDDFYNIDNPPKGQRIYKGKDKQWICWNCNIGNNKDPFWTPWWDLNNSNTN